MSHMTGAAGPLRRARLDASMLQTTLAERTGYSQAFISRVENGDLRGSDAFYELAAKVLRRKPSDLMPEPAEDDAVVPAGE